MARLDLVAPERVVAEARVVGEARLVGNPRAAVGMVDENLVARLRVSGRGVIRGLLVARRSPEG